MENKKTVVIAQNASLMDHFGLTTYLKNIINQLSNHKEFELYVIPLKDSKPRKKINKNTIIYPIKGNVYTIRGNIVYSYNLYKKLKQIRKVDVIHCLYPVSSLVSAVFFKKKHNKSVRIIYDVRSPWIEMGMEKGLLPKFLQKFVKFLFYKVERFLSSYVDEFIFISDGLKNHYEKKIDLRAHPYIVIPSGVDRKFFQNSGKKFLKEKYDINENDFIIGYSGTIQKMREMDFLINAFKNLVEKNAEYKFVFVGDGDDKNHLEKLSRNLCLNKQIIFTGKVPYEEMPLYISGFDIGVCHLPDRFVFRHSYPLKILEYISCKIPVLCSNIEAHRNISKNLKNVFIYKDILSFESIIKNVEFKSDDNIDRYDWKNISNEIIKTW